MFVCPSVKSPNIFLQDPKLAACLLLGTTWSVKEKCPRRYPGSDVLTQLQSRHLGLVEISPGLNYETEGCQPARLHPQKILSLFAEMLGTSSRRSPLKKKKKKKKRAVRKSYQEPALSRSEGNIEHQLDLDFLFASFAAGVVRAAKSHNN